MTMINCIKFRPKAECEGLIFREAAKIFKGLDGALHTAIINLDDGEYASIVVWESMEAFLEVLNREITLVDVLRPYVDAYDDGEDFHAISGPAIDLSVYEV